ncbi:MAG: nucleotide sugar dehydrogenase, partial [Bacilli bacterium]|nr:nucleotide sugar dehydrogenase [Bacilli bacterium]
MKIVISGTGYVGLVTAVCLAERGHEVVCIDVLQEKIDMLNNGISPIYEHGLEELMYKNKDSIIYTLDKQLAYENADVIFIGVGTPEKVDGSANLSFIYNVADDIAQFITKDCLVVIKSTVPIGTNYKVEEYINFKLNGKYKIEIASNPEFLAQGTAVFDTLNASRIVIGTHSKWAENKLREVYIGFDKSYILATDISSAEMIKYASNDFLALKISYVNEIANLCEMLGANI